MFAEESDKLPFNHNSFQVVINVIKSPEQLQVAGAVLPTMLSMSQMLQYVSSQGFIIAAMPEHIWDHYQYMDEIASIEGADDGSLMSAQLLEGYILALVRKS